MEPMERLHILDRLASLYKHSTELEIALIKVVKNYPVMKPALDEAMKLSLMTEEYMRAMGLFNGPVEEEETNDN